MTEPKIQNLKNHTSFDPIYHYVAFVLILILLVLSVVLMRQNPGGSLLMYFWFLTASIALFIITFKVRFYPLKVQDRIIRLEERLRLTLLLPENLKKRIPELTEDQLIGLRFASDDEVSTLVELALDKHLTRKEIKERIQNWRPDHYRI